MSNLHPGEDEILTVGVDIFSGGDPVRLQETESLGSNSGIVIS